MQMPNSIDFIMFAPCGINCMVCYKHCYSNKPCPGCLAGDSGKPEHCRKCKFKSCTAEIGITYCYECSEFPCKQVKIFEKSYQKRYNTSLIQNSLTVKEKGMAAFMAEQLEQWTCPNCGGIISLHDAECSECQTSVKVNPF